jgi:hypothetical protein
MERSFRQVNLLLLKNCVRTGTNLAALVLAMVLHVVPLQARIQGSTDYLLVEHVERLIVYNRYQQHITPEEQKLITPFVPIKILDAEAKLNDDFTPCMKAEIQGHVFYLLKNEAFDVPGNIKLGIMRIFKHVTVLNDTVRLTSSKKIAFSSPDQNIRHPLQAGKVLLRYFRDGKKTFIKLIGQRPEYGWVNFSDKNRKEYIVLDQKKSQNSDFSLSAAIQKRIQSKLIEANKALNNLFIYFNSETNTRKTAPQWRFVAFERQYVCILEPEEYAEQYAASSQYLAGEIESVLLGTNCGTVGSPGKIEIHSK